MGLVYEAANFKTKHMGSTTMAPVMVEHNITPSTPAVMHHLHDCITEIHTFALQVEGIKNAAAALAAATYSITTPVDNHLRKLRVSTYCFSALSARNFKHVMSSNPEKKFKNFVATASCTRAVALSNLPAIYQRVKRVREEEEEDNDDEGDDADEEVVA